MTCTLYIQLPQVMVIAVTELDGEPGENGGRLRHSGWHGHRLDRSIRAEPGKRTEGLGVVLDLEGHLLLLRAGRGCRMRMLVRRSLGPAWWIAGHGMNAEAV